MKKITYRTNYWKSVAISTFVACYALFNLCRYIEQYRYQHLAYQCWLHQAKYSKVLSALFKTSVTIIVLKSKVDSVRRYRALCVLRCQCCPKQNGTGYQIGSLHYISTKDMQWPGRSIHQIFDRRHCHVLLCTPSQNAGICLKVKTMVVRWIVLK